MLLVNFSHPLTAAQQEQIADLAGQPIAAIHNVPVQLDHAQPFAPQVAACVAAARLTPDQWQTAPILINPPGFAPAAAALIAELHGRMGHFPTLIRIRPIPNTNPTQYEVAELINLQSLRDAARQQRH